jgi:predicted MPP superfamily phosphohydrolase
MKQRIPFIILIWLIADIYFFHAVKILTDNSAIATWIYWMIDVLLIGGIILFMFIRRIGRNQAIISILMAGLLLSAVPKILALPVLLIEDIVRLFLNFPPRQVWVSALAAVVAAIPFFSLLYGMIGGRHHYKVHKVTIPFADLPKAFDGFTLTQLSDIHSGSFTSKKGVEKGIKMANAQNSDLLLFTGDLVNSKASEMDPWIPYFSRLKAAYGKYSVLGNHDYGDYTKWDTEKEKADNLVSLKNAHHEMGFKLLLNQAVQIKKDGQSIALIGVENWGKGGFHKYGSLTKAVAAIDDKEFKILMSHDPSHWEAKTLEHEKHIDLTLSGHTHGMQFGIEVLGFKWSPIKYVYEQWAGLYKRGEKYLYVNRGFGFLGFKGRVGIWPEITVITLKSI